MTLRVDQPNMREVVFDCPWTGHLFDDVLVVRNSAVPNLIGRRCAKCGCLIYVLMELAQIVGADGESLAKV